MTLIYTRKEHCSGKGGVDAFLSMTDVSLNIAVEPPSHRL